MAKRIIAITTMMVCIMCSLTGCKKDTYHNPVPENSIVIEISTPEESSEEEAYSGGYNDYESLEAMVESVKVPFHLPYEIPGYEPTVYSAYELSWVEAMYAATQADEDGVVNELIIRKQPGNQFENVTGDLTAYENEVIMALEGTNVTIRSTGGIAYNATFYLRGASYAIVSHYGMPVQEMIDLATSVVVVNDVDEPEVEDQ